MSHSTCRLRSSLLQVLAILAAVVSTGEASRLAYVGTRDAPTFPGGGAFAISPDGAHVYVAGGNPGLFIVDGHIRLLTRDGATGALAATPHRIDSFQALAIAISPDGKHVYTTAREGIQVFGRDPMTGVLVLLASYDGANQPPLFLPSDIQVSPDGNHVYASSFEGGSLLGFTRDPIGGLLMLAEIEPDSSRSLSLSPDGSHLYAAGKWGVRVFAREPSTGTLSFVENHDAAYDEGRSVVVSGDGRNVYCGGQGLTVYGRDTTDGRLTAVEMEPSPLPWLTGPHPRAVSPDGRDVYVTGRASNVAFSGGFQRDLGVGTLTFTEILGIHAAEIVVSPDGQHVYTSAFNSISAYRRVVHACSATPLTGCTGSSVAHAGGVLAQDHSLIDRDQFVWRWRRGDPVSIADFGDPILGGTDYAVCVYDAHPGEEQPRLQLLVPAGGGCGRTDDAGGKTCWKAVVGKGFQYASRIGHPDGVVSLGLRGGPSGRPEILLKGRGNWGTSLSLLSFEHRLPPSPLPLESPVTVQAQAANGSCWTSTFSTRTTSTDTAFRARSD